jgi:hypothetical protein
MKVKTLEIASDRWNQFLKGDSQAGFYHLWQWQEINNQVFGSSSKSLVLGDGRYQGVMPLILKRGLFKRRLMTPTSDWAGPLGSAVFKTQLVKEAARLSQRLGADLEVVSESKIKNLAKGLHQTSDHRYFILKTDQVYPEIFRKKIHKKTRNMVRKAEKEGVVIRVERMSNLDKFYQLYLKTMRKLGAIPLPKAVFHGVKEKLGQYGRLVTALYQTQPVGFLLIFFWLDTAWVWANVTDEDYVSLGTNYALWAKAIELACHDKKITQVNFGSSQKGSPQEFFKLRWGTEPKPVYFISSKPDVIQRRQEKLGRLASFLKHLPLPIYQLIGELAYRLY